MVAGQGAGKRLQCVGDPSRVNAQPTRGLSERGVGLRVGSSQASVLRLKFVR